MSSKLADWKFNGTSQSLLGIGGIAISDNATAVGAIENLWISTTDGSGISRLEDLKAIGQDSLVALIPLTGTDKDKTWTLRVSGEPSFSGSPVPHYIFPVGSVSMTDDEVHFAGGLAGSPVAFYAPSYGASNNTVTMSDTLTTTWDASSYESRSSRWDTREGDVRKLLYEMTRAKQNISFIYKESLRSMITSFNDVGYIDSEEKFNSIKCVHANAERAIAKLNQENNIILPILSIAQTVSANDNERQKNESLLVHEKYWDAEKHRAVRVLSFAPRAVNIRYQLNIWTKYMADMDQILEQVRLKFNPEMQVPTEFSTLAKAYLDSEEAVGQVTATDKEDRILKKQMNIVLRTYIPNPKFLFTSTGKIEEFKTQTAL